VLKGGVLKGGVLRGENNKPYILKSLTV